MFKASNFPKGHISYFGEDKDGFEWYLVPQLKRDWDLKQIGEDICEIFRNRYGLEGEEDFRLYTNSEISMALKDGFPICNIGQDYLVCPYQIRSRRIFFLNFGDAEEDCKFIAKKLSEKYAYLAHEKQLEIF